MYAIRSYYDIPALEKVWSQVKQLGVAADVTQGSLGRLLHYFSQVPGEDQTFGPHHPRGLNKDDFPAAFRPGKACGAPHPVPGPCDFIMVSGRAQKLFHGAFINLYLPGRIGCIEIPPGNLTADGRNLAFKPP